MLAENETGLQALDELQARAFEALHLQRRGVPINNIADHLGVSRVTVWRDLKEARKWLNLQPDELLPEWLGRYDELWTETWLEFDRAKKERTANTDPDKKGYFDGRVQGMLVQLNMCLGGLPIGARAFQPPKSETMTVRAVSGPGGVGVEVIREKRRLPADIMGEMREKGELTT